MKRGVGTQGSVMVAFASAWRVWRTKPARPVFEADVLRPHQPKGWWVLTITLRTPETQRYTRTAFVSCTRQTRAS